jgi:primosomal protein N'
VVAVLLAPALWGVWSFRRLRRRCQNFRCVQCGHDLRSSPFRCPECGMPGPLAPRIAHGEAAEELLTPLGA